MAGTIYDVFLGGDKLKLPQENWMDNSVSDPNMWMTYASHLKRTHFTVPFVFDRFSPVWVEWFKESGLTDLSTGDGLGATWLSRGSLINDLVVHVKRPLPGTKLKVKMMGTTADAPADVVALEDAVNAAKTAHQEAISALNASPDDAAKKKAVKDAKTALDAAEEALVEATKTVFQEEEIDFSKAGFYRFPVDKMLQTNGKVDVILEEGTLVGACFSVLVDVINFDDQHGCTCGQIPCDTPYPDPLCIT